MNEWPIYEAHGTVVHWMNGPYLMGEVGEAANMDEARKFAAALDSLARRLAAEGAR
jgi:hypothetical protein